MTSMGKTSHDQLTCHAEEEGKSGTKSQEVSGNRVNFQTK